MGYGTIIILAAAVGVPLIGYLTVRSKIRNFSRTIFGTTDMLKGIMELERESYNTPFSVSGGTSIYLPQIKKDFPDFDFKVVSKKAEQFFIAYFDALEKLSVQPLKKIANTEAIESRIQFEIDDLKERNEKVSIDGVKTNGISIWNYVKSTSSATITFQISMGYKYRIESEKTGESGVAQVKYELDMSYLFEDSTKSSFSLNCQNCGGPITDTQTVCPFCGTGLVRNIEMVWRVSGFEEQKKVTWKDNGMR